MNLLKILIVVTSHGQLGNTGKPTGYYLPEVAHPYVALQARGYEIDIASPQGGKAPLDARSIKVGDTVSEGFYQAEGRTKLENTLRLSDVRASDYAAVLYAGGHGTMWDFNGNADIERLNREIYEEGGVVAAVCHGPAAVLSTVLSDGTNLIDGKNVTGFSNAEEDAASLTQVVPFALETEMRRAGAKYTKANLWQEYVVVDGRIVTGQNPASAGKVGEEIAKLLTK